MLILASVYGCRPALHTPERWDDRHLFKPAAGPVISSPVVSDVDSDGHKEIAVGSWDGYLYLVDADLSDLPGWPKFSRNGFFSSPAVADLDGDGQLEIVAGSEAGQLLAWHADGRDVEGFPLDLVYKVWASPTVWDGPQIAIGGKGLMYVLDAQGTAMDGWPQPIQGWPDATVARVPGLLAVTTLTPGDPSKGWAYAWSEKGELLPGFPVELAMDVDSSPAIADLDRNDQWWIVFGDDAGYLHVLSTEGQERTGFPVRTFGPGPGPTPTPHPPGGNVHSIEASPAVADLDGDGRAEIVVGSWDGRMYVWTDDGRPLPGWPIVVGDQIISSAALFDLDGDDRLDIVVGSKDHRLYGWTLDGDLLAGFPYDLRAEVFSSPWVGDLDDDGQADVVVGANNGIHLIRDVGTIGRAGWPMFHKDERNSGAVQ
jgi:hypothetical protein